MINPKGFSGRQRALKGIRGHQKLQQSRPAQYEPEVPISCIREESDFSWEIRGRIDGLTCSNGTALIEEIKTVNPSWDGKPDPLHWSQLRFYGWMLAQQKELPAVLLQLTYFNLAIEKPVSFFEETTREHLDRFGQTVCAEYAEWLRWKKQWLICRNHSLANLRYPYSEQRKGQELLIKRVREALESQTRLFVSAPTGLGKTISVLWPSLQEMGQNKIDQIFFLTAKTIGRTVAQKTLRDLAQAGMRLKSLTLTARDKICFSPNENFPCDPAICPHAIGYYDRIKIAMQSALTHDAIDRKIIEEVARAHQVCPFALSLDLIPWVDLVIGDYNYVFDPSVSIVAQSDSPLRRVLLVDEAHNLVDRAREMFSADLSSQQLKEVKSEITEESPACARAIGRVQKAWRALPDRMTRDPEGDYFQNGFPSEILSALDSFLIEAEKTLALPRLHLFPTQLQGLYFEALRVMRASANDASRYVTLLQKEERLRIFCLDPAPGLQRVLEQFNAAIFFSATLAPLPYYRESLGGAESDSVLQLPSPYPPENQKVLVVDSIDTTWKKRAASLSPIVDVLASFIEKKPGKYLFFFPSHQMLRNVYERFHHSRPDLPTIVQQSAMDEGARTEFLSRFESIHESTVLGFAVLGGIFSEGIDLPGEQLIGVAVVSVGLPQINLERNLIARYYQEKSGNGFDYAYRFPGLNRVLQAGGRLIRSEEDRGMILLIDRRFSTPDYADLLPAWWQIQSVQDTAEITRIAEKFWQ